MTKMRYPEVKNSNNFRTPGKDLFYQAELSSLPNRNLLTIQRKTKVLVNFEIPIYEYSI